MINVARRIGLVLGCGVIVFGGFATQSPVVSAASTQPGIPTECASIKDTAQQASCVNKWYASNNIPFYDPFDVGLKCPPGSGTGSDPIPSGGSNAEIFYKFLVQKGLTATQAAGIIGNVMQESGGKTFDIKPDALNPSSGAYGIVQWYAGRKAAFEQYASSQGKPKNDLGVQMDYVWVELTGPYYKPRVLDPIRSSNTLEESTRIWLEKYEIPCNPGSGCDAEMRIRMPLTTRAYEAFSGLSADQVGTVVSECGEVTPIEEGGTVDPSGYAFPLAIAKNEVKIGNGWPCQTSRPYCHHDGTAAFDLLTTPYNDIIGKNAVAIYDGVVEKVTQNYGGTGCQSIQFKANDGYYYWYGHLKVTGNSPKAGDRVEAGDYLAKIGPGYCTIGGSVPHLHIDRGYPKGRTAGEDAHRDPAFIPLMNKLYENLP